MGNAGERPSRIVIHDQRESVSLWELIGRDATPLHELTAYDRGHLATFEPTILEKYGTPESALQSIQMPNFGTINFGIWDQAILRGGIDLTTLDTKTAEIGYWVGKEHNGNRYASRAQQLLAAWTFNHLSFTSLITKVAAANIASQRTSENAGFTLVDEEIHRGETMLIYELNK